MGQQYFYSLSISTVSINSVHVRTNSVSVIIVMRLLHTVLTLTLTTLYKRDVARIGSVVDTAKRLYDNVYDEKYRCQVKLEYTWQNCRNDNASNTIRLLIIQ